MELIKYIDFTKEKSLDLNLWNIAVGDKWANNELQHYTDSKANLFFDEGLTFKATLKDGIYESARINMKNKFSFKYGKVSVTAKLPKGVGTWPAIWMMPQNPRYGRWPKSGEIDIMEHVGRDLNKLFFCLHTEKYNHAKENSYYKEVYVENLVKDYHEYSIVWDEESITYFLDEKEIVKYIKGENGFDDSHGGWPFDQEFYLIINLAIGGKFGGDVDNTIFPQEFRIKEIKIYQ